MGNKEWGAVCYDVTIKTIQKFKANILKDYKRRGSINAVKDEARYIKVNERNGLISLRTSFHK